MRKISRLFVQNINIISFCRKFKNCTVFVENNSKLLNYLQGLPLPFVIINENEIVNNKKLDNSAVIFETNKLKEKYKNTVFFKRINNNIYPHKVVSFKPITGKSLKTIDLETLFIFPAPEDVYKMVQSQLKRLKNIPDYFADNFISLRIAAEIQARKTCCNDIVQDISLEDIYEVLASNGIFTKKQVINIRNIEENAFINLVKKRQDYNYSKMFIDAATSVIFFIVETIYSNSIIRKLMNNYPELQQYEILNSSVTKAKKETESLFQNIRFFTGIDFSNWTHWGCQKKNDYNIPIKLGINAVLVANATFPQAGSKSIRKDKRIKFYSVNDIGEKVGGPLFYPYVCWIIRRALELQIRRLYFIARDGFLLKLIADSIIKKEKINISTYYIYGSRKAWRMASFSKTNHDVRKMIGFSSEINIRSIKEIAKILQVPLTFLKEFIPLRYFEKEILTVEEYENVRDYIFFNDRLEKALIKVHAKKRKNVELYLKQEIDFSDKYYAFVELSGSGFTQECLFDIIKDFSDYPVRTFFMKMDNISKHKKCINYSFIPDGWNNGFLIEALCHAPHGQTLKYKKDKGKVIPILSHLEQNELKEHGYNSFISGVLSFVDKGLQANKYYDSCSPKQSIEMLQDIVNHNKVLDYLGDMPFSYSGLETKTKVFAPKLTVEDVNNIFIKRDSSKKLLKLYNGNQFVDNEPIGLYYEGSCFEISILRTEKKVINYMKHITENNNTITVVITSYNRKYEVKRAIESVLNQVILPDQILLIDDCSSDGTIDYINSFNFPSVQIMKNKKHMGAIRTRNMAIKKASSQYILFLDCDDILKNDIISFLKSKINSLYYNDIIIGSCEFHHHFETAYLNQNDNNIEAFGTKNIFYPSCIIYKKDFLKKNKAFDEDGSLFIDWDFILKTGIIIRNDNLTDKIFAEVWTLTDGVLNNIDLKLKAYLSIFQRYYKSLIHRGLLIEFYNEYLNYFKNNYSKIFLINKVFQACNYDPESQHIINNLERDIQRTDMQLARKSSFYNLLYKWLDSRLSGFSIAEKLKKEKINTIAIYGAGRHGLLLYKELHESGINVKFFIDQKEINNSIIDIPIVKNNYSLKGIKAVIISPYLDFENIKKQFDNSNIRLIALDSLIYGDEF